LCAVPGESLGAVRHPASAGEAMAVVVCRVAVRGRGLAGRWLARVDYLGSPGVEVGWLECGEWWWVADHREGADWAY
jgi:hypothetical protein